MRDRRHRAESCQILVTVPDCLDILLLSPTKAGQNWAKKIKWILFDEVHTINDPLDGPVWERILQLTTCPFLALSATVGQPEAFRSWLSGTRKERVELIVHSERYNDLRQFVCGKSTTPDRACELLPLHPCTFLSSHQLAKEGFPSLADFESRDTFALWEAMVDVDASAKDLAPELFFLEPVISRQKAKAWAVVVKVGLLLAFTITIIIIMIIIIIIILLFFFVCLSFLYVLTTFCFEKKRLVWLNGARTMFLLVTRFCTSLTSVSDPIKCS